MPAIERQHYVEVAEVSKIYRNGTPHAVEAVSSVSFTVPHGQFVAILGPSGCGKSTLLMMVGGLEPVTAGTSRSTARRWPGRAPASASCSRIRPCCRGRARSTTCCSRSACLKRPHQRLSRQRAGACSNGSGSTDFAHKKPHELSGGMRQRVAICRALVYDPEFLLMDEPFSALDAITRDEMNELLLDLWQQYTKTALFVTHSIREAVFLADRVLVMTRRPATIVEDLAIPFARPRPVAIGESREFNEICGHLRERIEDEPSPPARAPAHSAGAGMRELVG